MIFLLVASCSDDDLLIDQTPPSFTVTQIPMDRVSSFIAFGESLTPTQQNPAIEYFTNQSDIEVRAVSDGVVEDIRMNINIEDFEVWIKPSNNSNWLIIYDHVLDINISVGDQVDAGQIIGVIGIGNRTELQVNDDQNIARCPLQFGTENFVQQHINFSEEWCTAETVIP
ncbi:Peptidase family M23 [Aquimarina amphilecti]|uniref:Peptidase family M23 n=2 Tax=Aquimarina amphilecti TaxID=1038014 RepID=A0A1H7K3J6_AQUAM|nr:Peptidase family M23 [Aquimarina amphilecti]